MMPQALPDEGAFIEVNVDDQLDFDMASDDSYAI